MTAEEIIEEAKKSHPEINDEVIKELRNFLISDLNKSELNNLALSQISTVFLNKQIKKDEN